MTFMKQPNSGAGLRRKIVRFLSQNDTFSTGRSEKSHQDIDGCGFSHAVFPKDAEYFTFLDGKIQILVDQFVAVAMR